MSDEALPPFERIRDLRAEAEASRIWHASYPGTVGVCGVVFRRMGWEWSDGTPVYLGYAGGQHRHMRLQRLLYLQRLAAHD